MSANLFNLNMRADEEVSQKYNFIASNLDKIDGYTQIPESRFEHICKVYNISSDFCTCAGGSCAFCDNECDDDQTHEPIYYVNNKLIKFPVYNVDNIKHYEAVRNMDEETRDDLIAQFADKVVENGLVGQDIKDIIRDEITGFPFCIYWDELIKANYLVDSPNFYRHMCHAFAHLYSMEIAKFIVDNKDLYINDDLNEFYHTTEEFINSLDSYYFPVRGYKTKAAPRDIEYD